MPENAKNVSEMILTNGVGRECVATVTRGASVRMTMANFLMSLIPEKSTSWYRIRIEDPELPEEF